MNKQEAEMALSIAVSQYVQASHDEWLKKKDSEGEDAFIFGLLNTLQFCAGSVMTCFFLAARRGSTSDEVDLSEVEGFFRDLMGRVTNGVCKGFPKQLAGVDDTLARSKGRS